MQGFATAFWGQYVYDGYTLGYTCATPAFIAARAYDSKCGGDRARTHTFC